MRLVNGANSREHWAVRKQRATDQRTAARCMLQSVMPVSLPATIRIVRIGKRKMDSDGLAISAKHVRDGIADAFGVDDGSDLYSWEYAQEIGKSYGVRIEVTAA